MTVTVLRPAARLAALLALALLTAPAFVAADEPAAADPRADLLAHMERTQKLFLDSIAGLSEAQWSWKPAPDRWSVGECAEHITRTEPMLRGLIAKMLSEPTDPAVLEKSHGKAETILAFIALTGSGHLSDVEELAAVGKLALTSIVKPTNANRPAVS